ncbi:uncharacterized protein B0I36DRAFT_356857 [Microdochium trichocladiopsis]|uniref:Uncharacterized protein n=1 Tax=Microdochium trichocladiopsis TaxID=1682393 RepID=A0A9P8XPF9_9PEZI|nr:uncharacterized protein B0I36DRAFT_356857 [Microdochium trichocladiopsis]KAH7009135.1 hypothetical protein B0I36DRAFT_356857 [Microdochium trichocladiopsis]
MRLSSPLILVLPLHLLGSGALPVGSGLEFLSRADGAELPALRAVSPVLADKYIPVIKRDGEDALQLEGRPVVKRGVRMAQLEGRPVVKRGEATPQLEGRPVVKRGEATPQLEGRPVVKRGEATPQLEGRPVVKRGEAMPQLEGRPVVKRAEATPQLEGRSMNKRNPEPSIQHVHQIIPPGEIAGDY